MTPQGGARPKPMQGNCTGQTVWLLWQEKHTSNKNKRRNERGEWDGEAQRRGGGTGNSGGERGDRSREDRENDI